MNPQNKDLHRDDGYWDRDIETIKRDKLRGIQQNRLKEQLEYVYEHSSFYHDKFIRDKFHPKDFKSIEDIQRIPITHKHELRDAISKSGNPLPHLCVLRDKIAGYGCSRGTTGKPTFSAFTQEDIDLRVECYTRSLFQIGLTQKSLFHSMIGIQSITHFILKEVARRLNVGYINDGVDNVSNSVHIGRLLKPTGLLTGVRTLFEMEKILEEENHLPKDEFSYERIVLYGDVVGSHLIGHVKEKWGAQQVFSLSGSAADLLWYNFDCPAHSGNHCLNEDMFLVEVIDPQSRRPVKSGEKGEIVVTDLSSKGAPHIRWNLEDVAIPFYELCPCGRTHMRLKYLGRALYEVKIKGKEIFPVEIEHLLWNTKEIEGAEFRIVKYDKDMDHLKLQIEFGQEEEQSLKAKISHHLKDKLGIKVEVELLAPGELPVMDIKTPRVIDLTTSSKKT
jgi:phenylacetate-CoA ligase